MRRLILLIMIICTVGVNAQSRHTSRTAEPAEQHRDERREDNQKHNNKQQMEQPVWVATPEQVMMMVNQLKRISFSQEQVEFAVFCVKLLPVPAEGIMRLAQTISFDNDRLAFLKSAFKYCPDPYNYNIVEQALSFSSNAEDLRKYIEKEYNYKY